MMVSTCWMNDGVYMLDECWCLHVGLMMVSPCWMNDGVYLLDE